MKSICHGEVFLTLNLFLVKTIEFTQLSSDHNFLKFLTFRVYLDNKNHMIPLLIILIFTIMLILISNMS